MLAPAADEQANIMFARYYSSGLARFMAVDPGNDVNMANPQSWNKYAYVGNNPHITIDPDGRKRLKVKGGTWKQRRAVRKQIKKLKKTDKRFAKALKNIKDSPHKHAMQITDQGGNTTRVHNVQAASDGTGTDTTTTFNPSKNVINDGQLGSPDSTIKNLAHEISHVEDGATGTRAQPEARGNTSLYGGVALNETKAVRMENKLSGEFGVRTTYKGKEVFAPTAEPEDPGK